MDTYKIPLVWQMYGHCHVEANSLEEAIEIALGPDAPLPDGTYVDDSVAVDYEVLELDQDNRDSTVTKQDLRVQLQQGRTLNDLLAFGPGQDCEIFKADKFYPGDVVIYVPDVYLNHIPIDRPITDSEELAEVLSGCYTGQDFINECGGDKEKAERLFGYCDWQYPSSALDDLADDDEEEPQMKYTLIDEKGQYALILRGESMTQYAVVNGLDKNAGSWDWTCCYYDFDKFSGLTKAEALFKALDYYLMRTNEEHIFWARMSEIATVLKDGLIEDDEEEAYRYMVDVAGLTENEAEYLGLDMERYRAIVDGEE